MSGIGPNELEERRVMRLLADAAADVAPLPQRDVDAMLGVATGATTRPVRRRRPVARQLQHAVAVAAAAAVVISSSLALTSSEPQPASSGPGASDARLASFPEGSALRLLLSIRANGGNS
jgi:ferric-dicitrate binding protein FerR (iron transport regulator)